MATLPFNLFIIPLHISRQYEALRAARFDLHQA
jgi:hypothetical protein